jgi:anti-repressor protein
MTEQTIEQAISDPDFIIRLATELKTEKTKRLALEAQAEADKPKVIFADAVSVAKTSILIGELAKILKQNGVNIGQNRLFEYLRNKGYLISRNGSDRNMPTQRAMEMGLFEVKETIVSHSDGHTSISKTPKVTGKGQQYFINHFLKGA